MYRKLLLSLSLLLASATVLPATAQEKPNPVRVGLTAEFGLPASTSAQAIERGLQLAISEINGKGGLLGNRKIELVVRDDRSLPARAQANIREMAAMPDLVGIFGGKYSPVILEAIPFAQEVGIPLLAVWSSADGITDPQGRKNYVFRLSMTDSWAIKAMADYLLDQRKLRNIGLLLPNTAWGRSNLDALQAYKNRGRNKDFKFSVQWYSWGEKTLLPQYQALEEAGAEALLMVANEVEGALAVREIAALPPARRIPIAAHWGITGGDFVRMAGSALREVDLGVVQTFSFNERPTARRQQVIESAKARFNLAGASDIQSQVGFAHAYDLMHILALAIQRAGSTDRAAVRKALEELPAYDGLVRSYRPPFTARRHEALAEDNVFMARFRDDGSLARIGERP